MPSVPEGGYRRNFVTPLYPFRRDRINKHLPKIAPGYFGAIARVAARVVE